MSKVFTAIAVMRLRDAGRLKLNDTVSKHQTYYSNFGYWIAGRIVETLSGMPLAQVVKKEILLPLGMSATDLEPGFEVSFGIFPDHQLGVVILTNADDGNPTRFRDVAFEILMGAMVKWCVLPRTTMDRSPACIIRTGTRRGDDEPPAQAEVQPPPGGAPYLDSRSSIQPR